MIILSFFLKKDLFWKAKCEAAVGDWERDLPSTGSVPAESCNSQAYARPRPGAGSREPRPRSTWVQAPKHLDHPLLQWSSRDKKGYLEGTTAAGSSLPTNSILYYQLFCELGKYIYFLFGLWWTGFNYPLNFMRTATVMLFLLRLSRIQSLKKINLMNTTTSSCFISPLSDHVSRKKAYIV